MAKDVELAPFQQQVDAWVRPTFGEESANSVHKRCSRFLEEAAELVQAADFPEAAALHIVRYVYSRAKGDQQQEVGGVGITLAALCTALSIDQERAQWTELLRCHANTAEILAKQEAKHKHIDQVVDLPSWPQTPGEFNG